jgi:hypothetical protein
MITGRLFDYLGKMSKTETCRSHETGIYAERSIATDVGHTSAVFQAFVHSIVASKAPISLLLGCCSIWVSGVKCSLILD